MRPVAPPPCFRRVGAPPVWPALLLAGLVLAFPGAPPAAAQCVSLASFGTPVTENFDTLASSGTSSVVPAGWYFSESGTNANTTYTAGNGSGTSGDTYSFGTTASSERAFGGLQSGSLIPTIGACFTNNTGGTITNLSVSYTGEEWRLGTAARTDRMDFQYSLDATSLTTGTWVDVNALDFITPNTATTGAKDGNAAGNRTALSQPVSGLSVPNGASFWIRWTDLNASGSDDGLSVDDFSLTAVQGLSVGDTTVVEGDSGTVTATFTVSLSAPAGPGGVTFDVATADNTATVADSDYQAVSLTGQSIPQGSQSTTVDVLVNGDTTLEPTETFFVNVTNVVGAAVVDGQGVGSITNDDAVEIFQLQGNGLASPFVGQQVITRDNIVTALDTNGFYIQTPDARADADPETSNGILVFTGSAPTVAVGDQVDVTGTVQEFFNLTELSGSLTINVDSSGNPLPAIVDFDATRPSPNQPQPATEMERFESMLVLVQNGVVTGPSDQFGDVRMVAKPVRTFREPGILYPGLPNLPVWDGNPEVFDIDPNGLTLPDAQIRAGSTIVATGPLSFAFGDYSLLPTSLTVSNVPTLPDPVRARAAGEFSVGSQNVFRFFDTVDDPNKQDDLPTPAQYATKLEKLSRQVRQVLGAPDILVMQEVENITVLTDLAARIQTDDPSIVYTPLLMEGNDVSGIDVGYLVRNVQVGSLTQFGKDDTYINPQNGLPEILNDRPPLVLDASFTGNGAPFPLTVIGVHPRSLSGIEGPEGPRIREKRHQQALRLSQYVQSLQAADPTRRIIVTGDFNGFQFTDGYVDVLGQTTGNPDPLGALIPATDEVNPDLTNQVLSLPAAQRYSFVFDGSAQVLDHALTAAATNPFVRGMEYARGNADAPVALGTDATTPLRSSDHDGLVLYVMSDFDADGVGDDQDNCPGISNPGQEDSNGDGVGDACAPTAADDAYDAAPGFALNVPAPGVLGNDTDPDGDPLTLQLVSGPAQGSLTLAADGSFRYRARFRFQGTDSFVYEITDSQGATDQAVVTLNVAPLTDVAVSLQGGPDPQSPGGTVTYSFQVQNNGPSPASGVSLTDTLPGGVIFQSATTSRGAFCSYYAGIVRCSVGTLLGGTSVTGTIVVVAPSPGFLTDTASTSGLENDTNPANNSAQAQTLVGRLTASPRPLSRRLDFGNGVGNANLALDNQSPLSVGFQVEELNVPPSFPIPGSPAQDIPWLSVLPTSGTIGPLSVQDLTATFSASGQTPGLKRAQVRIIEDSPFTVPDVPVCFTVGFLDVPAGSFGDTFIHAVAGAGVSSGCGQGLFCPASFINRAAMAIWLLKAKEGAAYAPPPATGTVFGDVPAGSFGADYIEELFNRGITTGCGGGNYCPTGLVTRAQDAVFLLRTLEGSNYTPPPATGLFADVPVTSFFARWVEELFRRGITSGCGGGNYCPNQSVSRAQMAVFVVRTFGLPLCP